MRSASIRARSTSRDGGRSTRRTGRHAQRAAARWETGANGLTLRIDADTEPWSREYDGEVRVSHLQTGQFSGPVGSRIGQHRFRDGLVVREEQPERALWLPRFGVIEARLRAIRHPDAMVAFWPIGFEDDPEDSGEICIARSSAASSTTPAAGSGWASSRRATRD